MRQACILIASRRPVKNQDTLEIPEIARKYVLKRRAERQDETRKRIVEAAVDLHTTIGPAHTSDLAIAKLHACGTSPIWRRRRHGAGAELPGGHVSTPTNAITAGQPDGAQNWARTMQSHDTD